VRAQTVSIALGAALVAVVDYRLLLATMAVVVVVAVAAAAACLAGEPRARKSPESGVMPPASNGQSRVPVGNIG
jgi:hypothetical protein